MKFFLPAIYLSCATDEQRHQDVIYSNKCNSFHFICGNTSMTAALAILSNLEVVGRVQK